MPDGEGETWSEVADRLQHASEGQPDDWWLVYLYDDTNDGRYTWTTVGLVKDRSTWQDWWLQVMDGKIDIPERFDGWWCSDRLVDVGLPEYGEGDFA